MRADHTMTRTVVVVPPNLPLLNAWELMGRLRIRHLPVVQAGVLLGMLSDRDVLLRSELEGDEITPADTTVAESMSPAPWVCDRSTHVADIVRTMTERKIDAMPVMDAADKLVGLVTSTDLLLLLIEHDEARPLPFEFEIEEVAPAIRA